MPKHSNYTPGPWILGEHITRLGAKTIAVYASQVKDAPSGIFLGSVGTQSIDQVKANARLITTAPVMYEALQTTLALLYLVFPPDANQWTDRQTQMEEILASAIHQAIGGEINADA